jgi:carnitine 3-dehydrogenase
MTAVAVLGCGLIGSSWLRAFHSHGMKVRAWDPDLRRAQTLSGVDNVEILDSPEEAVAGAGFVQESGPEDLEKKKQLYEAIAHCLHAEVVLASSTSTLQPSLMQGGIAFADRIVVGHPFNPPHVLPLVEVVGGKDTALWAIDRALAFYRSIGKYPIHLRTERLGHLANRLQAALWREAVDAVQSGQAAVEDVDAAVTLALGPRWALLGPFATFHLGGGEGGLSHFLQQLQGPLEAIWNDAHRPLLTKELRHKLVQATAELFANQSRDDAIRERDERLKAVLSISRGASWSVLGRPESG